MITASVLGAALGAGIALWTALYAWRRRDLNRPAAAAARYPSLGLANLLTLGRGLLLAPLAAACPLPQPQNALPGLAYLLSILLDFLDGWVARRTRRESLLGQALDLHYDALGVLLATILLVRMQKAPLLYLLAGLARPLFVLGEALLRRLGRTPQPLQPRASRRTLAGLQMAFLAAALLPVFPASVTRGFAWLFFLPFAGHFLLDFRQVAGWQWPAPPDAWRRWGPIGLRLLMAALTVRWFAPFAPAIGWPLAGLLALGLLPRLSAAALVVGIATLQAQTALPAQPAWALAALAVGLLHIGGGPGLWVPDERLFTDKLGG